MTAMVIEESPAPTRKHKEDLVVYEHQAQGGMKEIAEESLEEKVKRLEVENTELKRQRTEDARANEKVACIFATQEQNWIAEKKSLRRQMQALFVQFRVIEAKKEETISCLNKTLEEKEREMRSKDEEMVGNREQWEEKMRKEEELVEELKERLSREAEARSGEVLKHEAAVAELTSKERLLESEVVRSLRELEVAKRELEEALRRKEEAERVIERMEVEIAGQQRDGVQKDNILSAMLRKSKLDGAEKCLLAKEVKVLKARRKQAELEAERWRSACKPPRRGRGFRVAAHLAEAGTSHEKNGVRTSALLLDYLEAESRRERELTVVGERGVAMRKSHGGETDELVMIDVRRLEDWIQSETEKNASLLEQRHCADIEAFTEQMRLKDEKLEGVRREQLGVELELKRLRSRVHGLEASLSRVEDENAKLESLLLDKDRDLRRIKEAFTSHVLRCRKKRNQLSGSSEFPDPQTPVSEKQISRRLKQRQWEADEHPEVEEEQVQLEPQNHSDDVLATKMSTDEQEEVLLSVDAGHVGRETPGLEEKRHDQCHRHFTKGCRSPSPWKMDINAMGVSYKIRRLKQQLLVAEKLMGRGDSETCDEEKQHGRRKGIHNLVSLLSKQAKRYQSLEEKADDLCKRMEGWRVEKEKGTLLEEAFELQRYVVAMGQRLMEIQSKMACRGVDDMSEGFDVGQFTDMARCLLREIQRGLEIRVARMIGDIEGKMASDGILLHIMRSLDFP